MAYKAAEWLTPGRGGEKWSGVRSSMALGSCSTSPRPHFFSDLRTITSLVCLDCCLNDLSCYSVLNSILTDFPNSPGKEVTLPIYLFIFGCSVQFVGILVPWPGMQPMPPAVEVWSPNHWTTREFPRSKFKHIEIRCKKSNGLQEINQILLH